MTDEIAVCVCTYRRPAQLGRLLAALGRMHWPPGVMFIIVDNAGDSQTEKVVREFERGCRAPVTYLVEPDPGLSPARNTALRAARTAGARAMAMLDDDEWPSVSWLVELIKVQAEAGAAIVGGPVIPVFETARALPEQYRSLWSVQQGRLGGAVHVYCTCNCLIDLSATAFLGEEPFPFDFRFTGGEDVVFFRRLHAAGIPMAWSEKAVVYEGIPADRATIAWLRRRWYRLGNIGVRCEQAAPVRGDIRPLVKTILLAGRLLIFPLVNRRAMQIPLLWLLEADRIRGRLASHAGVVAMQYGPETVRRLQ